MGRVLIYGTTLASYRAAANFAKAGHKVILLNRGAFLWHKMTQMQWQQPRDIVNGYSKGILLNVANMTGNVEIYHHSEFLGLEGGPGNFKVKFKFKPQSVDEFKCIGCDLCHEKCDVKFIPMPLGPGMRIIQDPKEAERCVDVCPARAIQIPREEEKEVTVDVVVLSPEYEPEDIKKYVGDVPHTMAFRDFAWLFRGKGVEKQFLKRDDGKTPKSLGFFIPVGFKNWLGSSEEFVIVFREALLMKEMDPSLDVHIFAKEIRLYGHNQMVLVEEAKEKGIQVHIIDEVDIKEKGDSLELNGVSIDLLVVMPGQKIPEDWEKLAQLAGIELENGFAVTKPFSLETSKDGVFAIGEFVKPVGSTEAIYQGTAIVPQAVRYLKPPEEPRKMPQVEWVRDDFNPKVGVFICECAAKNLNIDVKADYVVKKDYLCLHPEEIVKEIKESGVNRVVFGACSPALRGTMLEMLANQAGIHSSYVELVQLREYVSRVGGDSRKANAMLQGAIEKAKANRFVDVPFNTLGKGVAIIGGGLSALIAADYLVEKVPMVYIVAKEFDPPHMATGVKGNTLKIKDEELKEWYEAMKDRVLKRAKWIKGDVDDIEGYLGNFKVRAGDEEIDAGILIIATGGDILEKGNRIDAITGETMHGTIGSIYAKRKGVEGTYTFMSSYSLMDLDPPSAKRGEGEPVAEVKPREINRRIAEMLGMRLDDEGFFFFGEEPRYWIERIGIQFMVVEYPSSGVFVAGLAHRPMSIEEEVYEAGFAAQNALFSMSDAPSPAGKFVSTTNPRRCAGCGLCVDACFAGARYIDEEDKIAKVRTELCVGCAACANACPSGAAIVMPYHPNGVFKMLKEVVK